MIYFLIVIISFFLGYSVGIKHEKKKYLLIEDEENEDMETVIKQQKEPLFSRVGKSIKRNIF